MEEIKYSDVFLDLKEDGESLITTSTQKSFYVAVFDENQQECTGRMDSIDSGMNIIGGAIACLSESMVQNDLDPESIRGLLHSLVDDVLNDYVAIEDISSLN